MFKEKNDFSETNIIVTIIIWFGVHQRRTTNSWIVTTRTPFKNVVPTVVLSSKLCIAY